MRSQRKDRSEIDLAAEPRIDIEKIEIGKGGLLEKNTGMIEEIDMTDTDDTAQMDSKLQIVVALESIILVNLSYLSNIKHVITLLL